MHPVVRSARKATASSGACDQNGCGAIVCGTRLRNQIATTRARHARRSRADDIVRSEQKLWRSILIAT